MMARPDGEQNESDRKERKRKRRGGGLAQILHDRARKSIEELHRLVLTFSTAILAIYFLALTTKIEPALTRNQTIISIVGLISLGLAVIAGLASLFADTKRNYFRACALQATDQSDRDGYFALRDRWLPYQRWATRFLYAFFIAGIASSVIYVVSRILGW
jgi:uncharacterized membrane protein YbhN (UPF0104 family)